MLKIEGKYLEAKPVTGSKKTLLVTFTTKAGNLDLIVSSDQWMRYFVNDNAPRKNSNWQLVVKAKAIPELNQTMLGLVSAKPNIGNPEESLGKVVDLLQKIYARMGNIKQYESRSPALSRSTEEDDDNNNNQIDYEAVAQNYQPKVENHSEEEETQLPEVPDEQTRQFSLDQQPAKKPNPKDIEVDQGTGDSVTDTFFRDTDEEDSQDSDATEDNEGPAPDDSLGDGPLNLTDAL